MLVPVLSLSDAEAMQLADAQLRLQAAYGIEVSERTQAMINFVGVHAVVLGTKVGMARMQRAQQEAQARAAASQTAFGGGAPNQPWTPPTTPPPRGARGPEPTPQTAPPGAPPPAMASNGGEIVMLHGRTDRPLDYGTA